MAFYRSDSTGQYELFADFRSAPDRISHSMKPPRVPYGQLYVDPDFQLTDALQGELYAEAARLGLGWKRPRDICPRPQLYTDGRSMYDVQQGGLGTCYFLVTVASLARSRKKVLDYLLPPDAYSPGSPSYNGTFHARFWHFGAWEDIYIDDCLPTVYGNQLWGAHSATDKNEMWISLLEKAFARHYGSYNAVTGGSPADVYVTLTGGVGETINNGEITEKDRFFGRVENALNSGCEVMGAVPKKYDKVQGLVGAHAYTITGCAKVRGEKILRLRNPWANSTEWTGRWSDGSPEWQGVSQEQVPHADRADGEFWMPLDDYLTYFDYTYVCSVNPDFDFDGKTDSLDYTVNIFGQWIGRNAVGCINYRTETSNEMMNPKYLFTVPESGVYDKFEEIPIVIQLIQKRKHRLDNGDSVMIDLFKVVGESEQKMVLRKFGDTGPNYFAAPQICLRVRLTAGKHCIMVSTFEPRKEREFLVRIFSHIPLGAPREVSPDTKIMKYDCLPLNVRGKEIHQGYAITFFGKFRAGVNDGAQGPSMHKNPQFLISVPQDDTVVNVQALQTYDRRPNAIGLRLFPLNAGDSLPLSAQGLLSKFSMALPTVTGSKVANVIGYDVSVTYVVPSGLYGVHVFNEKEGLEHAFAVVINSSVKLDSRGFQIGV